jgi:glycerophosphoryl diester phosphodiesterase
VGHFCSARRVVIAHRGASGRLPELTLEAFDLAIDQGADAIELDIVPTRDGVLLARHENQLSVTTDVADHAAFNSRQMTKVIAGGAITGWFAEDFLASEIGSLRARQRFGFRDHSPDDRFSVPTLDDVLEWLHRRRRSGRRELRLFIEIKHPTYFARNGLDVADLLSRTLADHGLLERGWGVVAMSFETGVLHDLRDRSELPLIQLLDAPQSRPFDRTEAGDSRTYADMITPRGLAEISQYAVGIGPWKRLIVPARDFDVDGAATGAVHLAEPTSLISDAHAAGLFICPWTFRDEPQFLAADYAGDPKREYEHFFRLGVDAVITDFPDTAVAGRTRMVPSTDTLGEG